LAEHNAKYAVLPRETADYHVELPRRMDLDEVFCLEEERKVSPDWVVQYGTRWLHIEGEGQKAISCEAALRFWFGNTGTAASACG
jgi:hypothetical protein